MPFNTSSYKQRRLREFAHRTCAALSSQLHGTMSLVVVMSTLQLAIACSSADKKAQTKAAVSKSSATTAAPTTTPVPTTTSAATTTALPTTAAAKPVAKVTPAKPFVPIVIPDSADQLIFGFHAHLTDQGVAHGTVTADSALLYDDATRIDLRGVTVSFESVTGIKIGTLAAERGTLLVKKSTLAVRGNVVATGADNRRLATTRATFNIARNVLVGDTAYEMSGGLIPSKTKGNAFELDGKLTKPVIVKPVVTKPSVDKTKNAKAQPAKPTTGKSPSTKDATSKPPAASTTAKPAAKPPV